MSTSVLFKFLASPFKANPVFWRVLLRYSGLAFALYCLLMLAAILILPTYLNQRICAEVAAQTGRQLSIQSLSFNPFRLALTADQLSLAEADKSLPFVQIDHLYLNLSSASIWRGALVLDELVISKPRLHIARLKPAGQFNFSDIVAKIQAMPASPEAFHFAIANLQIQQGQISFEDQLAQQHLQLQNLQLGLPFISNFPQQVESFIEPHLRFELDGKTLALQGRSKPFADSHESRLSLNIERLDLRPYLAYLPETWALKFKAASLSSALDLLFLQTGGQAQMQLQGKLALHDWHLQDDQNHDLLKFAELTTEIKQIDWQKRQLEIAELSWQAPQIWLDLDKDAKLNWLKLLPSTSQSAADSKAKIKAESKAESKSGLPADRLTPAGMQAQASVTRSKPDARKTETNSAWHWSLAQAKLKDGQLHLSDAAFAKTTGQRDYHGINAKIQHLSSRADAKPAQFEAQMAAVQSQAQTQAEQWQIHGQYAPALTRVEARLQLKHSQLADYQAWLQKYLNLKLTGEMQADADLYSDAQGWQIKQASLALDNLQAKPLQIDDTGLSLKQLKLAQFSLESQRRQMQIAGLDLYGLQSGLRRDKAGAWNWQNWLASPPVRAENSAAIAAKDDTSPDLLKSAAESATAKPALARNEASPWLVTLSKLSVQDSQLAFQDETVYPSVSIQADKINAELLNWQSDLKVASKLNLQAQFGRKAQLNLQAALSPGLSRADLDIDANAISMASLFPYVSPYLNVSVTRARADIKGKLQLQQLLQADALTAQFDGKLALNNFHALENGDEDDFLSWKSVQADGVHLQWGPQQRQLLLDKLSLNDFYARLVLSEKGKLNLQNILVTKANQSSTAPAANATVSETKGQTAKATPAFYVQINASELNNGNINFSDNFIKPNYTANLTGVSGVIGKFASDQATPAKIELTGKVDDDAPLLVSGTLNPLAQPVFLDIKGSTNGLELPRLTPYAAKYAGYAIEKGKLSVQVAYKLENHHLQAQNDLRLDQLTFGEKIESPHATRLPVQLAVALLKDSDGQININLPISGSLSDPQFSVGSIISKVFMNLLTKAVTSPFALLSSLFGGGEELSSLDFLPGSASLNEGAKAKLDTLAKALNNRPGLKLDILGRAHAAIDLPALREAELAEQLREMKWKDLRNTLKAQPAKQANEPKLEKASLVLTAEEERLYLQKLYNDGKWDKPKNVLGLNKTLSAAETKAAVLQHWPINDDDLLRLAQQRADVVRDYLEDISKVNRERMFIIAPKLSHESGSVKQHRVDFSLK